MFVIRTTNLISTILFHPMYPYFTISNRISFRNSLLLFRYKSTKTNNTKQESSILENQGDNIDNENRSPASINIILKNSFVKENDIPWTGEEDIKTTVLRMIVDKYPPLKIKRNSIKEYIPPKLSPPPLSEPPPPPIPVPSNKTSNKKSITKLEKIREAKQSRIISARDAATDYSINKKFCAKNDENVKDCEQPLEVVPKSIMGWNSLVERRIQEAMAAGKFKNLPYHGKPLPTDSNEQNPYLDRTEFLMNRIVQRQGASPAWIEYQKDVNREIYLFRQRIRESWLRYTKANNIDPHSRSISWENEQTSYYEKVIDKLNSRLCSYNIIAPYPAQRNYLSLKLEFERMYQSVKQDTNCKARDGDENKLFENSRDNNHLETKEDDNIWINFAKSIRWWFGK